MQALLHTANGNYGGQGISAWCFRHPFIRPAQSGKLFNSSLPQISQLSLNIMTSIKMPQLVYFLSDSNEPVARFQTWIDLFFSHIPVMVLSLLKPKWIKLYCNGGKQLPTINNILFPRVKFVRILITSMKCKFRSHEMGRGPWPAIQSQRHGTIQKRCIINVFLHEFSSFCFLSEWRLQNENFFFFHNCSFVSYHVVVLLLWHIINYVSRASRCVLTGCPCRGWAAEGSVRVGFISISTPTPANKMVSPRFYGQV